MIRPNTIIRHPVGTLMVALLLGAPLAFWTVINYGMPMGYAGMFSLMAEQIAFANFRLPMEIPYYGPGGLPFAYPPLGLYLLASFIKITGKVFIFLRLVPPLLSLLSLIPLYYLTLELAKSKLAGFAAVLLAASAVELHIPHAWAAGIVRAPAFGFSLLCILFFQRAVSRNGWQDNLLAGIAFGATILSHLYYALFAALWIFLWNLTHPRFQYFFVAVRIALIGTLVAAPWLTLILSRHGMHVFTGAFNSHGNTSLISIFEIWMQWPVQIWHRLQPFFIEKPFLILIGVGLLTQAGKKQIWLPVFFFTSFLLFADDERFSVTIGCLLAGFGVRELAGLSAQFGDLRQQRIAARAVSLSILILLGIAWYQGLERISRYSPRLFSDGIEAGYFFQQETPLTTVYLALTQQDEAEWLPYLFKREPLVAQWGSEWLGTYDYQTIAMLRVRACQTKQDLSCLKEVFIQLGRNPEYLVTLQQDKLLNRQIAVNGWMLVYQNSRYVIWQKDNP